MSLRKSQRCKSDKEVKISRGRNECLFDEMTTNFKCLEEKFSRLEKEWVKKEDDLKRGWEMEYKTRKEIEEELVRNEIAMQRVVLERDVISRRCEILEENEKRKDEMLMSEIRQRNKLERRVEDIELKLVFLDTGIVQSDEECMTVTKHVKEIGNSVDKNAACFDNTAVNAYTQHKKVRKSTNDCNTKHKKERNREDKVRKAQEQENIPVEGVDANIIIGDSIENEEELVNIGRNRKEEKRVTGKNKLLLLVGDINTKTAREFCKEEGWRSWTLPGIDINNLEKMIKTSRKSENESPDELIIYVGREDVRRNDRSETIVMNLSKLFKTTREKYGNEVKINMCRWSKNIGRYLNEKITEICREEKVNMIKINPRWEIEEGEKSEMYINWQVAIGKAIRKSMKYGQQKQNEPDFRKKSEWRRTKQKEMMQ
jgi:hypothetical protein